MLFRSTEVRLASIEISGDSSDLDAWLGDSGDLGVTLSWVEDEDRGIIACNFMSPRGFVRID